MLKKRLLIPVSAALLALGALGLTAYADQGATPTQPPQVDGDSVQSGPDIQDTSASDATPEATSEGSESATETPESATETVEPGEPALPGGGHDDAGGANADHEVDGVE